MEMTEMTGMADDVPSLACSWDGHMACGGDGCSCHCHDLLVLSHHPNCDGECLECPVLWTKDERDA